MKFKYLVLLANLAILLTGCIDEIKLNIDTDQQKIVVDGLIADSLQDYTIQVNYSAVIGIGTDDLKTPVTGATVRVLDDAGGSFNFTENKPGVYTRQMKGEVGKAYHVEVVTADGKTILSRPSVLTKSPPLLPATARVVEEATISTTGRTIFEKRLLLEMNTDVSDQAARPFLRWRAVGEYEFGEDYPGIISRKICYIKHNVDFNNIKIFDTNDLEGGLLANEPFLNIKYDYRFAYMYCFHLFQYSISEEEYKYWSSVRDIVNISGNLLDPPPGTVRGNLYNPADPNDQILGYFSVAGVVYRRQFTNAIELGVTAHPRCASWSNQQQYSECRECSKILNSTVNRPVYWKP